MLTSSVLGLNYCRVLTDHLTPEAGDQLAAQNDYCFAVCYGSCNAPTFETVSKYACVIDLSAGPDAAFSRFHNTSRNEVRRSEKIATLRFRFGIDGEFDDYFSFYRTCEHARGWFPVPEGELRSSVLCTAFFDGEPISGMSAYSDGDRLRVGRIFSMKKVKYDERLNNLVYGCAAKRIVFELCRYGVMHGFGTLDLGGLDPHDPAKAGITKFKLSMGGQVAPVTIARYANARFLERQSAIRAAGYDIT